MASSCLNTISEDRVNKVCSGINSTECKPVCFAFTYILTQGTAEKLLIRTKQMQCKVLQPFPEICVPCTWWRGLRGAPRPSLKAPHWAKPAAALIPYAKITPRSSLGLEGQDTRCTQGLAPLMAAPDPQHR